LAFTLKAASHGFGAAKPFGDSERYDVIVDSRQLVPTSRTQCGPDCPIRKAAQNRKPAKACVGREYVGTAAIGCPALNRTAPILRGCPPHPVPRCGVSRSKAQCIR
jgi:hypothetical protein